MAQDKKDSDLQTKKKAGRPKGSKSNYNYHSKTKAKMNDSRSVKTKENRIAKLKKEIKANKASLKNQKKVLNKLDKKQIIKLL